MPSNKRGLLDAAAAGDLTLVLHQMVITELVYVLRNLYVVDAAVIATMIEEILELPGVAPVDEVIWSLVLDLWPEKICDFTGAALAAVMAHGRYDAVTTFDRPFARQLAKQGGAAYWGG